LELKALLIGLVETLRRTVAQISYAQMAEDIVLWRALKHRRGGFFVDVGAHHPIGSSVTKIFSIAGWTGINIEPIPALIEHFAADRPTDVNLAIGISDVVGNLQFFDVVDDQQRSTFDRDLADMYRAEGRRVEEIAIPVTTLDSVFENYVKSEVDFLKIDAEGHEEAVIRSLNLKRWRPHVILAEGALHQQHVWPGLLEKAGYRQTLFDGVNRFFVAEEHFPELGSSLSYPACPLDDFVAYDHLLALNALGAERDALRDQNEELQRRVLHLEQAMSETHLTDKPRSWRRKLLR
jgi:FkbM family methyltransferase